MDLSKPNFGGTVSCKGTGCREVGWTQKARRRRTGNWLDSNADALNGEKQGSDFCDVSCTICVFGVMKIGENWSIWFLSSFVYPGSWKLEKIEEFGFLWSFVYMGTQNSQKLNASIFSKIEWPRVHETSLQYHLLTLGSLSISYSGGKGPYLGGLSHLLYNIDPKVRIFSTFIKRPKAAHCPRALYMWKKNGRQSNPRILVMHRSHRKKNWVDRWWFRLPSNRPKLVTI